MAAGGTWPQVGGAAPRTCNPRAWTYVGIHRHMWAFIRPMDVYGMHRSEASAQRLGELLATADTRDELATQIGHMGRKDHTAAELMRTCANEIADESSARDTATRTAHTGCKV